MYTSGCMFCWCVGSPLGKPGKPGWQNVTGTEIRRKNLAPKCKKLILVCKIKWLIFIAEIAKAVLSDEVRYMYATDLADLEQNSYVTQNHFGGENWPDLFWYRNDWSSLRDC